MRVTHIRDLQDHIDLAIKQQLRFTKLISKWNILVQLENTWSATCLIKFSQYLKNLKYSTHVENFNKVFKICDESFDKRDYNIRTVRLF